MSDSKLTSEQHQAQAREFFANDGKETVVEGKYLIRRRKAKVGDHLIDGEFQSDKYPETPRGLVPLKPTDPMAQDLLWEYAQRRRAVDKEFSADLEEVLRLNGFDPEKALRQRVRKELIHAFSCRAPSNDDEGCADSTMRRIF